MKARSLAVLFFITVAVVISGCSLIGRGGTQSTGAQAHKEISIDDFRARLQANPKAKVVDVRSEAEYKDWHIEGAIVIPLDQFRTKAESLLKRDEEILLYCHDGPMGTTAGRILTELGYSNVANMQGGINQWRRQGLPVVK